MFGMDRDSIQLSEIFHELWQNYPHYFLPDTRVQDSRSRHHDGIRATNHNFHHMPNNDHISIPNERCYYNVHNARPISNLLGGADASNFYNHRFIPSSNSTSHYAPQSYGGSSMEAVHNHNHHHLVQESYTDFHFQPATHYSVEHVVYPETASFSHWNNYELDPHQPLPHMQAMRGNNLDLQPQVPSSSNRHQTNNNTRQHNASNSSRDSHDDGYRNFGPSTRQDNSIVTFDGFAIQLVDGVILLEGVADSDVSNMRLEGEEDMSYEELLDLEEQMGHINTGLSEETIIRNLKVRTHISSVRQLNLNKVPSLDQEPEICAICQGEYENYDTIGSLGCRHDYHAVCIKKWLQEKNICPLCKSTALTIKS
ncbi:hypothetical protein ACSBR2_012398 [Camellia fascicularis]